ncbi:hypothetical protein [Pseudomonas sp. NFX15]|uniref:hypothetical protein n=1 Tax=Pseudomonas sp. NFX15 TaxID=2816958 RepID=UPI003B8ADCB7
MELPVQIAAGAALLVGTCVLARFFYVAIKAPEAMSLGLDSELPRSLGSRIYLGLVVISWVAFAFSGAHGLLSWLPEESAEGLASLIAFLSLFLLVQIERSAYTLQAFRRVLRVRRELEQLIKYATVPSQGIIEGFWEKARSAETASDREAYAELAELASALAERDNQLCDYVVSQVRREVAELAEAQQKAQQEAQQEADKLAIAAKAQAAKQEQSIKLRQALDISMAELPIVKTIDSASSGSEALLEPCVAKQKWQPLYDFGERLRQLGKDALIPQLLQPVAGVQPIAGVTFELVFNGTERDGHYDSLSVRDGAQGSIADGVTFEASLDGLIAAFFLRAALPGCLAWGHGFYDHDQEFIITQERAIAILVGCQISADDAGLQTITVPAGFRVCCEEDGTLTLKCLTYLPGKGFYDYAVSVAAGCASSVRESKLFQWGQGIYY